MVPIWVKKIKVPIKVIGIAVPIKIFISTFKIFGVKTNLVSNF